VGRAGIVAILDELDQREAEQPLVEVDGLYDVAADQGCVVDAAAVGGRPAARRCDVLRAQFLAPLGETGLLFSIGCHVMSVPR
jgi:hypothetical protein